MNEPKLRDDMIGEGRMIYAYQNGRIALVKDAAGNMLSYFNLTKLEEQRFDDFAWWLADAWKEWNEAQG